MVVLALVGCLNSQRERNRNKGIGTSLPLSVALAESNCERVSVALMVAVAAL